MARIYVSSTFIDLEEYRKEVSKALRRLGHEDVAMEYYVAEDKRPLDRCLGDVASCDVYVGIFAWRYGHIPIRNNPDGRSITELEYRTAVNEGKSCLIFLLSDEAPWPKIKQDRGVNAEKIEAFRQDLLGCERHILDFFENVDELTRKVNEAIIHWERTTGLIGKRQLTDWDAYREAVINKHHWVRLQVIAGASKQRGIIKIPLTEVFEPQLAAAGASRMDVPDEVLKYQQAIYGHRSGVPNAVVPVETLEPEDFGNSVELEVEGFLLSSNPELVLDVLGRERTQVILGGPGSGKSTILQYAMLQTCKAREAGDALPSHLQEAPIPFLVELRNYVLQKAPDFVSYIVMNSRNFYDAAIETESLINVLADKHQALVFFDGLDEVFDKDERRRVIDQFQTFAHRYPQARIVVTSRIAGYDRTALGLAGFEHYTLLPLTLGQIRHFADQWFRHYALEGTERTAHGLVQRIVESPRLLDLAGNPLLLTMMAVNYKDRDLPNERWRLYERCAETLLEDWDLGKGIEDRDFKLAVLIRTAQKSEILQRVSMYMLENGQKDRELNAIAYAPLLDIVACYLEEKYQRSRGDAEAVAVDILRHLMERTYVLAGIGERIFGFVHRTFMEYFAACRCQAQFNARKSDFTWLTRNIFGAHWRESEWEEVLLLLIAMLHDQGTPIHEVVESLRGKRRLAVPFNLAFAARCLGEAGDVQDPAHAQALLAELAQSITNNALQSRKERAQTFVEMALKAFASLAPLVAAPAVVVDSIDRLGQETAVTARMAAWQMGFALRSRKERLYFALAALDDNEEAVRRGAIASLEREWPGRADIGEALVTVVRTDRQGRVRQAALAAMQRSWRSDPTVLDAIASRVDEETGYLNVIRLIQYLAITWIGNPKGRDLVVKLAGPKPKARASYNYASVVTAAAQALARGWGGDPQALAFLQDHAINEPEPQTRAASLQAISQGWGGFPQALAFLQDRATNDPEPQTRAAGLQAISQGWGGDPHALTFLQERAANDLEPQIRSVGIRAILQGWGGDPHALTFLQERAANDLEPQTRSVGIWAISQGWRGEERALDFLHNRATSEPERHAREAVLEAISRGWGGDERALAFLQDRATNDPEPKTRAAGLRAISQGWAGDLHALTILQDRAANDREPQTRAAGLKELVQAIYHFRWDLELEFDQDRQQIKEKLLPFLKDRATNEPDISVRKDLIKSLIRPNPYRFHHDPYRFHHGDFYISTEYMLNILQDRAGNDPDVQLRVIALAAIEEARSDPTPALALVLLSHKIGYG